MGYLHHLSNWFVNLSNMQLQKTRAPPRQHTHNAKTVIGMPKLAKHRWPRQSFAKLRKRIIINWTSCTKHTRTLTSENFVTNHHPENLRPLHFTSSVNFARLFYGFLIAKWTRHCKNKEYYLTMEPHTFCIVLFVKIWHVLTLTCCHMCVTYFH